MSLLALPQELFEIIVHEVVAKTKLQKATKLREVCSKTLPFSFVNPVPLLTNI
jgi:hypothetical protein